MSEGFAEYVLKLKVSTIKLVFVFSWKVEKDRGNSAMYQHLIAYLISKILNNCLNVDFKNKKAIKTKYFCIPG
mgnify:CR=1 FL=1|jgi:hypothetical protein|tara:strand:- start:190 stop:408 length:219 start_codon:yes stop_codon:yes gene_type:complete